MSWLSRKAKRLRKRLKRAVTHPSSVLDPRNLHRDFKSDLKEGYRDLEHGARKAVAETSRWSDSAYNKFRHIFGDPWVGDEYGRHIFNATLSPAAAYQMDYEGARREGLSSDEAWARIGRTAGTSASILGTIFGVGIGGWGGAALGGAGSAANSAGHGGDAGEIATAGLAGAAATGLGSAAAGAASGAAGGGLAGSVAGGAAGGAVQGGVQGVASGADTSTLWDNITRGAASGAVGGGLNYGVTNLTGSTTLGGAAAGMGSSAVGGGNTGQIISAGLSGAAAGASRPTPTSGGNRVSGQGYYDASTGLYYPADGSGAGVSSPTPGVTYSGQEPGFFQQYGPTLVNLGTNLLGAYLQNDAAQDATNAQLQGNNASIAAQLAMFDTIRNDQAPYRDAGYAALGEIGNLVRPGGEYSKKFTMADFQADPGYDFRMKEGLRALGNSAAARGGALSGGAIKESLRYGQGLASQEYGDAFNRFYKERDNRFNQLASLANIGQTAVTETGQRGQDTAQSVGGLYAQNGTVRGNGALAQGNIYSNGLNSINDAIQAYSAARA